MGVSELFPQIQFQYANLLTPRFGAVLEEFEVEDAIQTVLSRSGEI